MFGARHLISALTLELVVFTVTPSKILMETFKSRIWEMKEDNYTKSLAKNQVCARSYARYSEKRFTQMYKALYGDAMFVVAQIWPPKTNRNIGF